MDCCTEHARASAGLPAIEPGMPEPAGTGLSRRSFLLRSAALGLAVYGAGKLGAFEAGVAQAAAAPAGLGAAQRLPRGRRRRHERARSHRRPALPPAAPDAGACAAAAPFAEDPRLEWHPSAARARRPARRGQGLRAPRRRLHQRRPVALHLAPLLGGRRARPAPAHRLARPRARPRRLARQPAAGRRARRAALADAGHRAQPGRGDRQARGRRLLDARRVGPAEDLACPRSPASATRWPARPTRRSPRRRAPRRSPAACATLLAPLGKDGKPTYAPPAAYPANADPFPRRLAGLRRDARRRAADPRRLDLARPAPGTRTPTRTTSLPQNLKLTCDSLLRLPARPRGARARRPRADPRVVGVRAPRGRERLRHRPWRGRRRLPDRHARGGPDGRRVPGPRPSSTSDGNLRATSDFRGVYSSLCGDWFGVDPAAILPDARGIGKPVMVK